MLKQKYFDFYMLKQKTRNMSYVVRVKEFIIKKPFARGLVVVGRRAAQHITCNL